MTPKEKAEDLFMIYVNEGMSQIKPVINRVIRKEMAKQCALIAVDEVLPINSNPQAIKYWSEVRREIQAL